MASTSLLPMHTLPLRSGHYMQVARCRERFTKSILRIEKPDAEQQLLYRMVFAVQSPGTLRVVMPAFPTVHPFLHQPPRDYRHMFNISEDSITISDVLGENVGMWGVE
eukprot:6475321-Amphidinium_carterae.1